MPTFPELAAYAAEINGDTLDLPIRGTTYTFSKSIPMRTGLALAEAREIARDIAEAHQAGREPEPNRPAFTNADEQQVMRDVIGDQWQRMLDDGVLEAEFTHVYMTLFTWHLVGEDAAMRVWTNDIDVEGDARPPARSASTPRKTSRTSSTRKPSANTRSRRSAGKTSSKPGT